MSRIFRAMVSLSTRTADTYRSVWGAEDTRLSASNRYLLETIAAGHRRVF